MAALFDEVLGSAAGLAEQPGRLRIGTIDAVNTWLSNRAPVSAGQSALQRVSDSPAALYREAARQTLRHPAVQAAIAESMWELLAER